MSSIAVDRRPFPSLRLPRGPIAATACLLSALAAVWTRMDAPLPFPTFQGACERLRTSGLPLSPRDWWCQPAPWTLRASFSLALLFAAIGIVLPGVILAAGGRRWSSLLPLLAAPWVQIPGLYGGVWWQTGSTGGSSVSTWLGNVAVLSAPIIAVWLVVPRRAARREPLARVSVLLATTICGVATYGLVVLARSLDARHFAEIGGPVAYSVLFPAVAAMGLFGIVLGTDRRWWPWSLAPVALLLSAAPSVAVLRGLEPFNDWSRFGAVMPLVLIGLTWSLWKPMTARLSAWFAHRALATVEPPTPRRWSAELNAGAMVLIAMSLMMFRADPLPVQIGSVLPTYLGARIQADDVRTKLNLRRAIDDLDALPVTDGYRDDAAAASRLDPLLAFVDGAKSDHLQPLAVSIERATRPTVRVVAMSPSGTAFCLQRVEGSFTYGMFQSETGQPAGLAGAIANCGSTPWTASAVAIPDVLTMCDGVNDSGYLICRMVQVLIHNTLQQTKPA